MNTIAKELPNSSSNPFYAWIVLLNITLITFLTLLLGSSVTVAELVIQGYYGINSTESQWISVVYLVFLASGVPLANWLAARFEYKRVFMTGLSIFLISTLFTALSPNYPLVLLSRSLEGFGAGCIMPLGLSLMLRNFPQSKQSIAITLYTAGGFGLGIGAGCYLGGYLSQYSYWQLIFYISFLIGLICFFLSLWSVPKKEPNPAAPFDLWGYITFFITIASSIVYVTNVKAPWNTDAFTSYFAIGFNLLTAVALISFLIIELKHPHPLFNLRLFKNPTFSIGIFCITFVGIMLFGTLTAYPNWFVNYLGYSKHTVGLMMIPFGLIIGVLSPIASWLSQRFNAKILSAAGLLVLAVSCFYSQYVTMYSSHLSICAWIYLHGVGIALSLAPVTSLSLAPISPTDAGDASVILTIFRQLGGSFGGALVGLITTVRSALHFERYGSQMNPASFGYVETLAGLKKYFNEDLGYSLFDSQRLAHAAIAQDVYGQSFTSGLTDCFYIFGWLVTGALLCLVIDIIFSLKRKRINEKTDG